MSLLQDKSIKLQTDDFIFIELWLASGSIAWLGIRNGSGEQKTFHVSTEPGDTRFEAAERKTMPNRDRKNFKREPLSRNEVWRVGVSNPKSGENPLKIFECSYNQLYAYHTTGEHPDVADISPAVRAPNGPSSVDESDVKDELNNLSRDLDELRRAVVNVGSTVAKKLVPGLDQVKQDIEPLREAHSNLRKRLGTEDDPFGHLDQLQAAADDFRAFQQNHEQLTHLTQRAKSLLDSYEENEVNFEAFQQNHEQLTHLTERAGPLLDRYDANESNLETFQKGLKTVVGLEERDVLSKLEGTEVQIKAVTDQLEQMNAWFSEAEALSAQVNQAQMEAQHAAKARLEDAHEIQQQKSHIEGLGDSVDEISTRIRDNEQKAASNAEAIQQKSEEIQAEADDLLQKMSTEAETNIEQIRQKSEEIQAEVNEVAQKKRAEVTDNAVTIQETLAEIKHAGTSFHETLKQAESDFRETQAEWIRQETGRQFSLAAEQLQQKYLEEIGAGILLGKQKGLQEAQELLEDFCQRMELVQKVVPLPIQNALQHIRLLRSQLDMMLPPFQPPEVLSLRTHENQQAAQIADALLQSAAPQPQSYQSYVQQAYHQALKEYARQLKGAKTSLTDETLTQELRNLALVTLNPFDSKERRDKQMHQIIAYFDKGVLPSLLAVFGYEEIPITIGQTQAVESLHAIVNGKPSQYPSGSIIEVLSKGLRSKQHPRDIVQRARVICAE